MTLKELKKRINELSKKEQDKTIKELYLEQYKNSLGKIFERTEYRIISKYDYDDYNN